MNVTTQEGILTDLSWWSQMKVEGDSVVLSDIRVDSVEEEEVDQADNPEPNVLILALLPTDQSAIQELFKDLNTGIRNGKEAFSVISWIESRKSA